MRSRLLFALALAVGALALAPAGLGAIVVGPGGGTPGTAQNFELVGHDPLFNRGMNAAPAIYKHFLYVGNRTDSSNRCEDGTTGCTHAHPGVLIVDIKRPRDPEVVGEMGPPHAAQVGITTRELRVWPRKKLLMIMTFRCSSAIHACEPGTDVTFPFDIKFFDLSDPVHPRFISSYVPTSQAGLAVKPHEMFLWIDPKDRNRALLWLSTPTGSVNPARPNLMVVDISAVPTGGAVRVIAEGNWNQLYPGAAVPANYDFDLAVHSMGVSFDGTRTHLAYLRGHYLMLDTSSVARNERPGEVISLNDQLMTPVENRPRWGTADGNCVKECAESHSAVEIPGRRLVLTTDEVYGTFTLDSFGCPWGWSRVIDVSDPAHPRIVSEFRLQQNTREFCGSPADDPLTEQFTAYSSHNPTVLRNLVLVTWHSGGFQAIVLNDPANPSQGGWFSPTPLAAVALEDPALSRGPNKVVMWSYPIIRNGLIYVVDIRNGLYVLRYTGPRKGQVRDVDFLEGNTNLGDARRLARGGGD